MITLDDEFAALAESAPGFGGLFYDSAGNLTVYLTDPARRAEAAVPIAAFLARHDPSTLARRTQEVAAMNVRHGQYDFGDLAAWYGRLMPRVAADIDVTVTDIDEARNRLVIGVTDLAAAARMRRLIASLGVPDSAVVVEEVPSVQVMANLQGTVRPVPAAVQINRNTGELGSCTLSYNARYRNSSGAYDGLRYFVTNSHCTSAFGVNNQIESVNPTSTAR